MAISRLIDGGFAVAKISGGGGDHDDSRVRARVRRRTGLAWLSAAAIDSGWLAWSTGDQRRCVGRLAPSIVYSDGLRARSGGVVGRDVHVADGVVWSVYRLAASGFRQRVCRRYGA